MKAPIYNKQEREVIKLKNTLFANLVHLEFAFNRFIKIFTNNLLKLWKQKKYN